MNLHEYQSKELFARQAVAAAQRLGGSVWVGKAGIAGRLRGEG